MSIDPNQPLDPNAPQGDDAAAEEEQAATEEQAAKGTGYSATDLPEGAEPDPLGDASLSARERAGASGDE